MQIWGFPKIRGYLILGSLYYLGYYTRVPYFRKLPYLFCEQAEEEPMQECRVRMSCKPRSNKFCKPDATTSDCLYLSVAMAVMEGLPRICTEQKVKILNLTSAALSTSTGSAVPLFWCESGAASFRETKACSLGLS